MPQTPRRRSHANAASVRIQHSHGMRFGWCSVEPPVVVPAEFVPVESPVVAPAAIEPSVVMEEAAAAVHPVEEVAAVEPPVVVEQAAVVESPPVEAPAVDPAPSPVVVPAPASPERTTVTSPASPAAAKMSSSSKTQCLVLNAGSSSLKYAVFDVVRRTPPPKTGRCSTLMRMIAETVWVWSGRSARRRRTRW